jgi:hypothetical protein
MYYIVIYALLTLFSLFRKIDNVPGLLKVKTNAYPPAEVTILEHVAEHDAEDTITYVVFLIH